MEAKQKEASTYLASFVKASQAFFTEYNQLAKSTKDIGKQYNPDCLEDMCNTGEVCGQGVVGQCKGRKPGERASDNNLKHWKDCYIPAEDTRLSNPSCNLRGTGWNRWEWLCLNPQDRVEIPFDFNDSE